MSEDTQDEVQPETYVPPRELTDEEKETERKAAELNSERGINWQESDAGKDLDNDGDVGVEGHDHPGTHAEGDQVVADK